MEDEFMIRQLQHELPISKDKIFTWEELTEKWGQYINSLIENDFETLIRLLYRVDVSEVKLKRMLKDHPGEDAGKMIASLIIERLLQKIKTREAHRSKSPGATHDPDSW